MDIFAVYLETIENSSKRKKLEEILYWVLERFPQLAPRVAWNQPMFTDHGTFIIGFSVAKHHLAVAPERKTLTEFSKRLQAAGYSHSKELFRIKWDAPTDFPLLEKIIAYNILDKADCKTFWRK